MTFFKELLTPEAFDVFARYLLSGYLIILLRSRFVIGRRPKAAEFIVEAIILSLINQTIFNGILWGLGVTNSPPGSRDLLFFSEVIALPSALGVVLGWNLSRGWNRALFRRLSMPIAHPVHRAHDFAFGDNREAGFVEITFEDGAKIGGWYGNASLASTDENRSDLYLERAYAIDDDGNWTEQVPPRAILVSLNNVRSIEFLRDEEINDG